MESLSNCKRFARVKCRYIEQSEELHHSKNQAIMLLETLKSLHSHVYVHSDVRKNNILFDDTKDEAYLIDFDLCDKENVNYPKVYNHASMSERHKDAFADKPRKKIHDVFSILKILQESKFLQCYPVDDIDAVPLEELIEKLKNVILFVALSCGILFIIHYSSVRHLYLSLNFVHIIMIEFLKEKSDIQ